MQPQEPTPDIVNGYIDEFNRDERYYPADEALRKLFQAYPKNDNYEEIIVKVATLNSLYSTNIYNVVGVAKHILDLQIDHLLQSHAVELVDNISNIILKGHTWEFYSFSTKYCNWHQPEYYPIYDKFVDKALWSYKKLSGFYDFKRYDLRRYNRFHKIMFQFQDYYHLQQYNYKEIDKFLWRYGKKL